VSYIDTEMPVEKIVQNVLQRCEISVIRYIILYMTLKVRRNLIQDITVDSFIEKIKKKKDEKGVLFAPNPTLTKHTHTYGIQTHTLLADHARVHHRRE